MNKDFHYGVIKVLARAAGFSETDGQIIAYASQYTDNAANHQLIIVEKIETLRLNKRLEAWMELLGMGGDPERKLVKRMYSKHCFDPVCTAHENIDFALGIDPDVQRKVYVPFHFIPEAAFDTAEQGSFITRPGAELAGLLCDRVVAAYQTDDQDQKKLSNVALCALGSMLHAYADSWAHEGFSGRWSTYENNVDKLTVNGVEPAMDSKMRIGKIIEIGHLDVSSFVDQTHGDLEYVFERGETIKRNNSDHFLECCRTILENLAPLNGVDPGASWAKIEAPLDSCLRSPLDSDHRIGALRQEFEEIFPDLALEYHKMLWEWQAVKMKAAWDTMNGIIYELNEDELWFDFHVAAAAQRMFIKRRIA
jgi:uncharacterized protein DUF6765